MLRIISYEDAKPAWDTTAQPPEQQGKETNKREPGHTKCSQDAEQMEFSH